MLVKLNCFSFSCIFLKNLNRLGGLFTHEYLSDVTIALGFERGSIAFIDTRMPRETYWCVPRKPNAFVSGLTWCVDRSTSVIESTLSAVGEIRRSKTDKLAIFGCSGYDPRTRPLPLSLLLTGRFAMSGLRRPTSMGLQAAWSTSPCTYRVG
jgi:hypothetical protein